MMMMMMNSNSNIVALSVQQNELITNQDWTLSTIYTRVITCGRVKCTEAKI